MLGRRQNTETDVHDVWAEEGPEAATGLGAPAEPAGTPRTARPAPHGAAPGAGVSGTGTEKAACALVFVVLLVPALGSRAQIADPRLVWRTISTPHFDVHYHEPLDPLAQRVASVAERVNATLERDLGYALTGRVQIVVSDHREAANAQASVVPRDVITLFAAAPDDLSPLGDYGTWALQLLTHEHTHVLHLNQIGGVPAFINLLLGKSYAPNQVQPRWFTEGLATYQESVQTSGGRLRSTMFDMFLRMDALEGNLVSIDRLSHYPERWPHGLTPYLYGSRFVQFIADTHGPQAVFQIGREYGSQTFPFGLNRMALRATGQTFVALYSSFLDHLRKHYRRQRQRIARDGISEGLALTRHGEMTRAPRFLRDGRIVYYAFDGRTNEQLRSVEGEVIVRARGPLTAAVHPDGKTLVFDRIAPYRDVYAFTDLFLHRLDSGRTSRLTWGMRAREPDLAPDGRRVAYVIQNGGTSHLAVSELEDIQGTQRLLVHSRLFEQVYTPRWSPDGRTVAFSAWRVGGKRDIVLLDVKSGWLTAVTNDRALDTGPAWSPDSRWLYFSSDRTGVANIYAFDRSVGTTYRVTNVVGGAYQPVVSPDGSQLLYVGYRSRGFDVYGMDLDTARFAPAPHYQPKRPAARTPARTTLQPSRPYDPLPTIWPDNYGIEFRPDDFGHQLTIGIDGSDVVGTHAYDLRAGLSIDKREPVFDAAYSYLRWTLTPTVRLFRRIAARQDLLVGGEKHTWVEEVLGGSLGLSYGFPGQFHNEAVGLSYSLFRSDSAQPLEFELDPNEPPPSVPETGLVPSLRLTWRFSKLERHIYDISPSRGWSLRLSLGVTDPVLGATYRTVSFRWAFNAFIPMPWLAHHVLGMRYAAGHSGGDSGRRQLFSVGGFPDLPPADSLYELVFTGMIPALGGEALRGYPPGDRTGLHFHLVQAEYRLPVWRTQAGLYTLPFFIERLYAIGFVDYGNAFAGVFDISDFRVGTGGELLTDITVGYLLSATLRVGLARGLSQGGVTQFYLHFGVPF